MNDHKRDEVLQLRARGVTMREIAKLMGVSRAMVYIYAGKMPPSKTRIACKLLPLRAKRLIHAKELFEQELGAILDGSKEAELRANFERSKALFETEVRPLVDGSAEKFARQHIADCARRLAECLSADGGGSDVSRRLEP